MPGRTALPSHYYGGSLDITGEHATIIVDPIGGRRPQFNPYYRSSVALVTRVTGILEQLRKTTTEYLVAVSGSAI